MHRREARLAVEVVEVLGLDHVKAGLMQAHLQGQHILKADQLGRRLETAAPVIDTEGLGEAVRPDLDAPVGNQLQQNLDDLYVFSHPPSDLEIEATPLTDNPLVVIAPSDHGLIGRGTLPWSALAGERLLMREVGSGTRHAIEQHAQSLGLALGQIITIASNEAIKESVAAGLGLAILSRLALTHMAPGNLVELPVEGFPIANRWYLVTAKGKQLSPIALAFTRAFRTFSEPEGVHPKLESTSFTSLHGPTTSAGMLCCKYGHTFGRGTLR